MAFLQTNATDTDDLMSIVTSFMASNGYTFIRSQTETINGYDMKTTTLQCPDDTYITFISTNTLARPVMPLSDNDDGSAEYYEHELGGSGNGASYIKAVRNALYGRYSFWSWSNFDGVLSEQERPWLCAIRHLTYNAGANWIDQPDAKRMYATGSTAWGDSKNKNMYFGLVAGADIPNVWVFVNENPDCVHIVTEYKANHYSHMTIGNLAKSHNYEGGEYIVGSVNCFDSFANYMGYMPQNIGDTTVSSLTAWCFGGVRCEGNGNPFYKAEDAYAMGGWGRVWQTTGIHVFRNGVTNQVDISGADDLVGVTTLDDYLRGVPCAQTSTGYGDGYSWLGATFDKITGQAAPIPLTSWCEHEASGAVYLGSWEHVAVIQMGALTGKEELTIGSETYLVFPLNALQANGSETMLGDGVDYTVPTNGAFTEITPYPHGHRFQLGLAIRKVV